MILFYDFLSLKKILYWVVAITLIAILLLSIYILLISGNSIHNYFAYNYQDIYINPNINSQFSREQTFLIFKINILIIQLFLCGSIFIWFKGHDTIFQLFHTILQELYSTINSLKIRYRNANTKFTALFILTLLAIIIYRIWYTNLFCFYVDEIFSYVNFVSKGILITSTYYPDLNNHIFYNLVCIVFSKIAFLSPFLVMRLPAILAGILVLIICYLYLDIQFRKWAALIGLIIIAFLPAASIFSIQGRGHIFSALFTFISLFCLNSANGKVAFRSIYIIASILAFYTAPTYFYPFCAFIIYKVFRLLLYKISANFLDDILIIVIVALLYSIPLISFGGYELLVSSNSIFRFSWDPITKSFLVIPFNWRLFPAFNYISLAIMACLPFLFNWNRRFLSSEKYRGLLLFYLSNIIVFMLVFLFQAIEIPPRIITYFNILNGIVVAVPIGYYLNKIKPAYALTIYLLCFFILFIYSKEAYKNLTHTLIFRGYDEMMLSAKDVSDKLITNKASLIYSESEEINSMLKLECLKTGQTVHFTYTITDPRIDYYILDASKKPIREFQDVGWDFEIFSQNKTLAKVYKHTYN